MIDGFQLDSNIGGTILQLVSLGQRVYQHNLRVVVLNRDRLKVKFIALAFQGMGGLTFAFQGMPGGLTDCSKSLIRLLYHYGRVVGC